MKIIIGLIQHESNSFNPTPTCLDEFNLILGGNILKNSDSYHNSSLEGIINVLQKHKVELIPTVVARPRSEGGLVAREAYLKIKNSLIEELGKSGGDFSAVCFAFHGSMTVEDIGDAEGDLLEEIRNFVGEEIPVVCCLDMHAMLTKKMMVNADAFVGYRTAPHIDTLETGEKTAEILYDSLLNNYKLSTAAVGLPILISGEKSESAKPPMNELYSEIEKTDQIDGVLSSSYFLGFPWADVEFNCGSALVVTRDNNDLAEKEALKLAEKFINRLPDFKFTTETHSFADAIEIACSEKQSPIFIIDSGDNPGAGASQDITCTLEYLLSLGLEEKILYAVITDKDAYQDCVEVGENKEIKVKIGRKDDNIGSKPIEIEGVIKTTASYKNLNAAVITVQGIDVIITSKAIVLTEPEFFRTLELDFKDYKIAVLKSGYLDPKLEPYTKRVILGLSSGYTNQVLKDLNYSKIKRPIYPFDDLWDLKLSFI